MGARLTQWLFQTLSQRVNNTERNVKFLAHCIILFISYVGVWFRQPRVKLYLFQNDLLLGLSCKNTCATVYWEREREREREREKERGGVEIERKGEKRERGAFQVAM